MRSTYVVVSRRTRSLRSIENRLFARASKNFDPLGAVPTGASLPTRTRLNLATSTVSAIEASLLNAVLAPTLTRAPLSAP